MRVLCIDVGRGMSTLVDADVWESERLYSPFSGADPFHVTPSLVKWRAEKNRNVWYAHKEITVAGKRTFLALHRLIDQTPPGMLVDHVDGNGLNNVLTNLRRCTHSQNMANESVRRGGTSPYRGVRLIPRSKRPWRAQIHFSDNGRKRSKSLGTFDTAELAAAAYDRAAAELFGEFARLNLRS